LEIAARTAEHSLTESALSSFQAEPTHEALDRQNRDGVFHRDQGQHPSAVHRAILVSFS